MNNDIDNDITPIDVTPAVVDFLIRKHDEISIRVEKYNPTDNAIIRFTIISPYTNTDGYQGYHFLVFFLDRGDTSYSISIVSGSNHNPSKVMKPITIDKQSDDYKILSDLYLFNHLNSDNVSNNWTIIETRWKIMLINNM